MNENKNKVDFEKMIHLYCVKIKKPDHIHLIPELEVRFESNRKNPLTKMDFDNVVRQLYSSGFTTKNKEGQHLLRISLDENKTNHFLTTKISRIRTEIVGLTTIQSYCNYKEDLQELLKSPMMTTSLVPIHLIKFTTKSKILLDDKHILEDVSFPDFNFSVSYKNESHTSPYEEINHSMISKWTETKKTFRYMNRMKFEHPFYPITADLSIIRSSQKKDKNPISEYTMENIILNKNTYEIELEIDNIKAKNYSVIQLLSTLRKVIRIILSGLHQSNYPIGDIETKHVLQSYMFTIHGKYNENDSIEVKDFIGPNCLTLQLDNLLETSSTHINKNYCVTDKADGSRSLLYISDNGRLYLIDTTMSVIFTGMILDTNEKKFQKSLLDGEYIRCNKEGKTIHLFAAFDIYYIDNKYIGNLPFVTIIQEKKKDQGRFDLLKQFIDTLKIKSIVTSESICHFKVKCKNFQFTTSKQTIYDACNMILSTSLVNDEYKQDGLIFTPMNKGVCDENEEPIKKRMTWKTSFKWKPPQHNTIDFLVKIKKDEKGMDEIRTIYIPGSKEIPLQYKTIELLCGFSHMNDGYINPLMELLEGKAWIPNESIYEYKPMKFFPTTPSDQNACYCNVLLENNLLKTEEGEYFDNNMIVEFRYDLTKIGWTNDNAWKWIPMCIRYDKMRENTKGYYKEKKMKPNYGNSYQVANNNWKSIHYPITEEMITTGKNIPSMATDDTLYYKRTNAPTQTRNLRDFHNIYVKRKLILGVASILTNKNKILIDFAVGKAGDLHKWIDAKLSFVFGIDIRKDNIENRIDGACSRYLNEARKNPLDPKFLKALFVVGDSSKNIRDNSSYGKGEGSIDEQISNAIFGIGFNDEKSLLKSIYNQYKIAIEGFDISSIQFSIHYFFKDKDTIHQFMCNVCECTKLGGYFIGTCYDGKEVFQKLERNIQGKLTIMTKDKKHKMLEITKLYHETNFPEEETCLGYNIDVWQESINQNFQEYLVNFVYLQKLMINYGFMLITNEEAHTMELPHGSGLFQELYDMMQEKEKEKGKGKQNCHFGGLTDMNQEEKLISFLNRYFVFKKVKNVSSKQIQRFMNEEETVLRKEKEKEEEDKEWKISSNIVKTNQTIITEDSNVVNKFKIKIHNELPSLGKRVIIKKSKSLFQPSSNKKENEKEKEIDREKEKETDRETDRETDIVKERDFLKRLGKQIIIKKNQKIKLTDT